MKNLRNIFENGERGKNKGRKHLSLSGPFQSIKDDFIVIPFPNACHLITENS